MAPPHLIRRPWRGNFWCVGDCPMHKCAERGGLVPLDLPGGPYPRRIIPKFQCYIQVCENFTLCNAVCSCHFHWMVQSQFAAQYLSVLSELFNEWTIAELFQYSAGFGHRTLGLILGLHLHCQFNLLCHRSSGHVHKSPAWVNRLVNPNNTVIGSPLHHSAVLSTVSDHQISSSCHAVWLGLFIHFHNNAVPIIGRGAIDILNCPVQGTTLLGTGAVLTQITETDDSREERKVVLVVHWQKWREAPPKQKEKLWPSPGHANASIYMAQNLSYSPTTNHCCLGLITLGHNFQQGLKDGS